MKHFKQNNNELTTQNKKIIFEGMNHQYIRTIQHLMMHKNNIIHICTKKFSFIFTLSHVTKHLMTYAHQKIGLAYGSCLTKQNEYLQYSTLNN